jgi:hypothetical protein
MHYARGGSSCSSTRRDDASAELSRHGEAGARRRLAEAIDESWSRTLDWLVRNRLLAPNYGLQ